MDPQMLADVAGMLVTDSRGNRIAFGKIYEFQKTVVVFIPSNRNVPPLLNTPQMCHSYVSALARVPQDALDAAGTKIVVIACGAWDMIPTYQDTTGFKGLMYSDTTCKIHEVLGLVNDLIIPPKDERTIRSYVPKKYTKAVTKGIVIGLRQPINAFAGRYGPIAQLGGDFILGPGNVCDYAHRMRNTMDHVEVVDLMALADVKLPPRVPASPRRGLFRPFDTASISSRKSTGHYLLSRTSGRKRSPSYASVRTEPSEPRDVHLSRARLEGARPVSLATQPGLVINGSDSEISNLALTPDEIYRQWARDISSPAGFSTQATISETGLQIGNINGFSTVSTMSTSTTSSSGRGPSSSRLRSPFDPLGIGIPATGSYMLSPSPVSPTRPSTATTSTSTSFSHHFNNSGHASRPSTATGVTTSTSLPLISDNTTSTTTTPPSPSSRRRGLRRSSTAPSNAGGSLSISNIGQAPTSIPSSPPTKHTKASGQLPLPPLPALITTSSSGPTSPISPSSPTTPTSPIRPSSSRSQLQLSPSRQVDMKIMSPDAILRSVAALDLNGRGPTPTAQAHASRSKSTSHVSGTSLAGGSCTRGRGVSASNEYSTGKEHHDCSLSGATPPRETSLER
ncbi:hypothetical protein FRB99_003475 [Tulasnella sp. 403]|nr:hypothetical protein FRB99_003475 [Tulasnella sp. 403]